MTFKYSFLLITTLFFHSWLSAQTLFSYGKYTVSKDEFLHAYNKNNSDSNAPKMSYSDYLDLYSKFRIKVQAAMDSGMDTLPEQKAELESFRQQLAESFLKEDASLNVFINEAAERSLKDIRLSHIFIPVAQGASQEEVNAAETKIKEAYSRLEKGEDFDKVAEAYNTRPALGFITVFNLPYEYENIAYSLPVGKFSFPHQSPNGFHILKNMEERKAVGQIRVRQILLAFKPGMTEEAKKIVARRADSVYQLLKNGADFAKLVHDVSEDNLTYMSGGEMPVFGVSQYDPVFEKAAFSLARDGDISMPFETAYGYHILSRIQRIPVIEDKKNKDWLAVIKEKVLQSDRMEAAHAALIKNIRETIQKDVSPDVLANDSAAMAYYSNHLESYNPDFAEQMNEFRQGNLLFSIMQKKVWDAASSDSAALQKYYNDHKEKYNWENSADALIITTVNQSEVENLQSSVKNNLTEWRKWADNSNGLIQADSGRFELSQIPIVDRTNFTEGLVTAPVKNDQDSSATFAYIIRLYKENEPKKFEDAKGSVINDYQNLLEEQWVAELKQKYPIRINKKVFRKLPKV